MSASRIIIGDDDRLPNIHPGEILREDFLIGSEIPIVEVATGAGIAQDEIKALLDESISVTAETALRLSRYFGLSEQFFLGLQNDYDLEEAKLAFQADLDRIVRRAA